MDLSLLKLVGQAACMSGLVLAAAVFVLFNGSLKHPFLERSRVVLRGYVRRSDRWIFGGAALAIVGGAMWLFVNDTRQGYMEQLNNVPPSRALEYMAPLDQWLFDAVVAGDEVRVDDLLRRGANVTARDWNGQTALHYAVGSQRISVVTRLLDAGASVADRNRFGDTPLDIANRKNLERIAPLLKAASQRSHTETPAK